MRLTELRPLRLSTEDAVRISMLKEEIATSLQTQFIAGGDNQALRERCDQLSAEIRAIEAKYTEVA